MDDSWATIGSVNLDNRSFALNDELNISFRSPAVVTELERHFLLDVKDSRELDLESWRSRPPTVRARELASAALRREL